MAGMWLLGLLLGLLLLAGVVVLTVFLVRTLSDRSRGGPGAAAGSGRGRQILEERYARGELSTEEYQERLRTLEEDGR